MDDKRFARLAEAYGGDLRRWPLALQTQARRLADDAAPARLLSRQAELDLLLDVSQPLAVSPALRQRILQSAPKERVQARGAWAWLWRLGVGAGLASATAAGMVFGLALNSPEIEPSAVAVSTLATPVEATAFGPAPEAFEAQEG